MGLIGNLRFPLDFTYHRCPYNLNFQKERTFDNHYKCVEPKDSLSTFVIIVISFAQEYHGFYWLTQREKEIFPVLPPRTVLIKKRLF